MPWCVVVGCKNSLKATKRCGKDVSYHIFPKNPQRRNAWINTLNQSFKFNADSSYICSEHFIPDDFESNSLKEELLNIKIKRQLKKSAIPSVNMPIPLEEKQFEVSVNNLNCQIPIEVHTNSIIPKKKVKEESEEDEDIKIIDVKMVEDELIKKERKKLVDKLLADYEEQQNNKSHLKGMITKYPSFFSPKINPNAKLGDKLRLLKAIENPKTYSPAKKRRISPPSKSNTEIIETPSPTTTSLNKNQIIQVSAVKGGLMLHALPLTADPLQSTHFEKNVTDEEEEIIIVTEDEASHVDLSSYEEKAEKPRENNTEVIIVTNLKETEDTFKHLENVPKKDTAKINDSNKKCSAQNNLKKNDGKFTPIHTDKVQLTEEKSCQVLIPCKGCEHRSLKINKLLRERTRLLKDHNQNGAWKDPDEITALRRMNGVLSLLLKQCVSEKYGKKSSSIRVDLVQDSIERIDRGWSMQDTSEALCQAFSVNAYDTFSRAFEIVNET